MGKKIQKRNSNFHKKNCVAPSPLFWAYMGLTFVSRHQLKNIYIFAQSLSIFLSSKEIQKMKTKIQPIGTCPKSHLSP